MALPPWVIREQVRRALLEDVGSGDITTELVVDQGLMGVGHIMAGQAGVVAGLSLAEMTFLTLDETVRFQARVSDGASVQEGEELATVSGKMRALLTGERTALNFLQRMSGIATLTREFVELVRGLPVRITDTRKTAPGLCLLDKYAVQAGGGFSHRRGLAEGILIKDNHIVAAGGVKQAVELARQRAPHGMKIQVEVNTLEEVEEALKAGADALLLDNMDMPTLRKAAALTRGRVLTEASGRVNTKNVCKIAEAGVDLISVGSLTHSAAAMDISMEVERAE
jgi:nicotinate-nucleotide pyrophosphorylase (carboxylating)